MAHEDMTQPFVILASQRTGSNMLAMALDSHHQARCFGELFRKGCPGWRRPDIPSRPAPRRFRDHLDGMLMAYADYRAIGFKIMYRHAPTARRWLLRNPQWAVIHLTRSNVLAQYSCWKNARRTGKGVDLEGSGATKVRFRSAEFERFWRTRLEDWEPVRQDLQEAEGPMLEIDYEQLTQEGLDPVCLFLGLDEGGEAPTHKRQSRNVLKRFENPEEVKQYLEDIGHPEWMFEDAREME